MEIKKKRYAEGAERAYLFIMYRTIIRVHCAPRATQG